jgi:hypothetical protein
MQYKIYKNFPKSFFRNQQLSSSLERKLDDLYHSHNASKMYEEFGYSADVPTDTEVILQPILNMLADISLIGKVYGLRFLGLENMLAYEIDESAREPSIEILEEYIPKTLQQKSSLRDSKPDGKMFLIRIHPEFVFHNALQRGAALVSLLVEAVLCYDYYFCEYSIELRAFLDKADQQEVRDMLLHLATNTSTDSRNGQIIRGSDISESEFQRISSRILSILDEILQVRCNAKTNTKWELYDCIRKIENEIQQSDNADYLCLLDFIVREVSNDFTFHECAINGFLSSPYSGTSRVKRASAPNTRFAKENPANQEYGWEPKNSQYGRKY